jgi:diaminohydroxyphosphoribosylaminopyrimidine deaminase/5-amino-6-(5-phosphoribosylamino)uracil reductase
MISVRVGAIANASTAHQFRRIIMRAISSLPGAAAFRHFRNGNARAPFVVAQLGQSLDGRIATVTGHSFYINGAGALDHLHAIRAHVDAVVVGIGTVVADDPQLNVRRVEGRDPARVVIDPNGRLPGHARILRDDGARRVVMRRPGRGGELPAGVEEILLEATPENAQAGPIPPEVILAALAKAGFARVLLEGGARTVSDFLHAGCIDRLHMLMAPVLIGSGKPGLTLPAIETLDKALRPQTTAYLLEGGDVLFDCDLRREREAITEHSQGGL